MFPSISRVMEQIDNRILRERALIFVTALAIIYMIWSFLFQARFDNESARLQAEKNALNQEQTELTSKISTLTVAMASDPAVIKSQKVRQLQSGIDEVEIKLAGLSQGLIGAGQLPKVLEEVLLRTKSVKLLQVKTLAASELQLTHTTQVESNEGESATGSTGVYKHAVLIRVAGTYLQLIELMTEIESLQWKFYWESLDYTVKQYPDAEIDIRVFTLSSEEGQLGV